MPNESADLTTSGCTETQLAFGTFTIASTFTWLDYSEHERRKMLDVIKLFSEKTTRDELGLGAYAMRY